MVAFTRGELQYQNYIPLTTKAKTSEREHRNSRMEMWQKHHRHHRFTLSIRLSTRRDVNEQFTKPSRQQRVYTSLLVIPLVFLVRHQRVHLVNLQHPSQECVLSDRFEYR